MNSSLIYRVLLPACFFLVCCKQPDKYFIQLSQSKTNIDFENSLPDDPKLSILSYIYYYNGGGVAIGDINQDGLPDIYFTSNTRGHNKLYLNKGNFEFEDITEQAGVAGSSDWCTGVTMADVNGDGLLDIYVCAIADLPKAPQNMDWIFPDTPLRQFSLIMITMVTWIVLY